jgi:predicted TIM-barrel enzyme
MTGEEAGARLRATVDGGGVIIGAGAGTGLSAKCAEAGGADLIIIYNSGRYRMAGRGSLAGLMPYGDANAIVMEMAGEVLPIVSDTPVLAGVCGTDPFRLMPRFLGEIEEAGFAGVQNFPTVGLIDGTFRANLEETGMGYDLEVAMIASASERGLLTAPYVFDGGSARAMAGAGADVLVPHMGLTTKGTIGARRGRWTTACRASRPCTTPPRRSTPRSSSSATAARSPSPRTPPTCCSAPRASSASSGRRRWSACPPRPR